MYTPQIHERCDEFVFRIRNFLARRIVVPHKQTVCDTMSYPYFGIPSTTSRILHSNRQIVTQCCVLVSDPLFSDTAIRSEHKHAVSDTVSYPCFGSAISWHNISPTLLWTHVLSASASAPGSSIGTRATKWNTSASVQSRHWWLEMLLRQPHVCWSCCLAVASGVSDSSTLRAVAND